MRKPFCLGFLLCCSALFLASCSSKPEPKDDAPLATAVTLQVPVKTEPTPSAKADLREVTLHLDGMSDRLNLV